MRCVLYARYSTDRQTEASIEDQLRVCREFAAAREMEIAGEFVDRGVSGAALGNRVELQRAMALLGPGDALVVNDLTRLSRSQDLPPLISRLQFRGVRVFGAQDRFDSEDRTASMQAGLSGLMSADMRAGIASRTHSALELRARDGRPTGGKAFGDVELVREIFGRFAEGESMFAIASDLNRRAIPSPGAKWKERSRPRGKWLVSTLYALLQNERYIGQEIWNRSKWVKDPDSGRRHRRERPRSEWVVRKCERIVDQAIWDQVARRFAHKRNSGGGGVAKYLLSGLLVCGVCNGTMIVGGGDQRRYVCGTRHAGGDHACSNALGVPKLTAEKCILEPLQADLLSPEAEAEGLRQMRQARAAMETVTVEPDHGVAELERLVREGLLDPEIAAPSLEAARRRAAARRAAPTEGIPWPTAALWRESVKTITETLAGPDIEGARDMLREIIGEVRCVPDGDYLVAELASRRVLLATGTGLSRWHGSGGVIWSHRLIRMPTRVRRRSSNK